MEWEINPTRLIGRIKFVSSDRHALHLEFASGQTIICSSEESMDFSVDDVVFYEEGRLETAPKDLWLGVDPWIGVVKLLPKRMVLIEIGGQLRLLPRPDGIELDIGNTVQGSDPRIIDGVLCEAPIRPLDLPIDAEAIRAFKEPPTDTHRFADFAGSPEIVARARELIETPLRHHEVLKEIGAKPIKGVLFKGKPGTGKTKLARIIASESKAQFYLINGPQIMSKWLGQSEELIRRLFDDARDQERAIIFFDEIDSLAGQRSDDSHEASRRVVGQLLTSMDGFSSSDNVVVIATTNRPEAIDKALRRPGRFDWEIYFPYPSPSAREAILARSQPPGTIAGLPHDEIAKKTEDWSAAELVAIWKDAALLTAMDERKIIRLEDYMGGYERVSTQKERKEKEEKEKESADRRSRND